MPKGPKGERRPADVIGHAVKVMWIWNFEELISAMDEITPKPARPRTYKKKCI
jgi:hypothetical protein